MSTVIKRSQKSSSDDLVKAIGEFCALLEGQNEDDAIADLKGAGEVLLTSQPQEPSHREAIRVIIDAFEGDHELAAYTLHKSKDPGSWTVADQLCAASSRVLSLAKRMAR